MELQSRSSSWIGRPTGRADAFADPSVAVPGTSVPLLRGVRGGGVSVVQPILGGRLQQNAATRLMEGSGAIVCELQGRGDRTLLHERFWHPTSESS